MADRSPTHSLPVCGLLEARSKLVLWQCKTIVFFLLLLLLNQLTFRMASLLVPCALSPSICRQTKVAICRHFMPRGESEQCGNFKCAFIHPKHTHESRNSFAFSPHRHNFSQSPFLFAFYTSSKNIFSHTLGGLLLPCTYHQSMCVCARNEEKKGQLQQLIVRW